MAPGKQNTLLIDGFILFTCALCWYLCTQKSVEQTTVQDDVEHEKTSYQSEKENMTTQISNCVATCILANNLSAWIQENVKFNSGQGVSFSGSSTSGFAEYTAYYSELLKEAILLAIGIVLGFAVAIALLKWQNDSITLAASSPKPVFTVPRSHIHLSRGASVRSSSSKLTKNGASGSSPATVLVQRPVSSTAQKETPL